MNRGDIDLGSMSCFRIANESVIRNAKTFKEMNCTTHKYFVLCESGLDFLLKRYHVETEELYKYVTLDPLTFSVYWNLSPSHSPSPDNTRTAMATKWGVVSAGKICHDFVTAVQSIPEGGQHEFVAIAARSLASAKDFATTHNIPRAYGCYEELAKDPDVEVVYIGTVASHHFAVGKLMLENGKHVLMEKPFTLNLKQTKILIKIARREKCFLMEAVWTRFLPAYKLLMELIEKDTIGDIVHVNVKFGIPLLSVERVMTKAVGGGTILDLGIYTINAVTMVYKGEKPKKIAAVGHLNDDGVDITMSSSLLYNNNRTANIASNALAEFPNDLVITGTEGQIRVPSPFWCPTTVITDEKTYEFPLPETIRPCNFTNSSGLRFEAMEVRECLKKGALESEIMPLKDTETMTAISDEIRRQLGVVFDAD
ncbi:Trans-1,2-dihydrobenzene-1,2-diol dehydrogenase [Araneus ventricosus]|uniref:Trans-1,2-dihydrobenzene-1,2-diol dehydrogenase n=1 Tax=Araneus ventricosus TaxID=182803 RepID=A0A4Y2KPY4_ARAVE|nr:Trans-1,2-dihydrobenzene-1,2-diol dehydrogenase [Araneus ventricosus]